MLKRQNTFSFDEFSKEENKQYTGKFTARIATFGDKTKINVRRSQLLGGMYCVRDDDGVATGRGVDEETEWTAYMRAYLEQVIVQSPEWFKFDDPENGIVDHDIILHVFKEVMRLERVFRGRGDAAEGTGGPAQGGEGAGAKEHPATNAGSLPKEVVGSQVPAALDP